MQLVLCSIKFALHDLITMKILKNFFTPNKMLRFYGIHFNRVMKIIKKVYLIIIKHTHTKYTHLIIICCKFNKKKKLWTRMLLRWYGGMNDQQQWKHYFRKGKANSVKSSYFFLRHEFPYFLTPDATIIWFSYFFINIKLSQHYFIFILLLWLGFLVKKSD